jgi:uncharacterized membrane protein
MTTAPALRTAGFVVAAVISALLYEVFFELRYVWFIRAEQALMVRAIAAATIVVILGLWLTFSSPLTVAAVAVAGFAAPALIDGKTFGGWDIGSVLRAAIPVGLLVGVTYLRKKWIRFEKGKTHRGHDENPG